MNESSNRFGNETDQNSKYDLCPDPRMSHPDHSHSNIRQDHPAGSPSRITQQDHPAGLPSRITQKDHPAGTRAALKQLKSCDRASGACDRASGVYQSEQHGDYIDCSFFGFAHIGLVPSRGEYLTEICHFLHAPTECHRHHPPSGSVGCNDAEGDNDAERCSSVVDTLVSAV